MKRKICTERAGLQRTCRSAILVVSVALLAHSVLAQDGAAPLASSSALTGVASRYPSGSIHSSETAELALTEAGQARSDVEQRFAAEKNGCLSRFFTSACMDGAKERRRKALEELKAVEVEANAFIRKARVTERDRALEEKHEQDEKDRQERELQQHETASERQPPNRAQSDGAAVRRSEAQASERKARHEAKLKQTKEQDAADAQKRADNISAYERKVQAAQARQKDVADRKAEKEREHAQKQSPSSGVQ